MTTKHDRGPTVLSTSKERSTVQYAQVIMNHGAKLTHRYDPELHRQSTEYPRFSTIGCALQRLVERGLGESFDPLSLATAKMESAEILNKLFQPPTRHRFGVEIAPIVQLHCYPHWHVRPDNRVVCLLPIKFPGVKVAESEDGSVLIQLPIGFKADSDAQLADIGTDDGQHVCPRKLHAACARLLESALEKRGVSHDDVKISVTPEEFCICLRLSCNWTTEIVPCVVSPNSRDTYYVTRLFPFETYQEGDIRWRPCFAVKDNKLLQSVTRTDLGLRMSVMHALTRILLYDWRLVHFNCYQMQTILLHDMDFHIDFSPRWQHSSMESCLRSLLSTLLYFVKRERLPHFTLNHLNLWKGLTPRQLTLAGGAIERLLTNENALISLLRRASSKLTSGVDKKFT